MKERPGAGWGTVALHDVAPAHWQACRDILADLEAAGSFPVSLLVVPRYHGKARHHGFEHWLRERQAGGDEIVLHGYSHLDTGSPAGLFDHLKRRCYTRGEGEFAALTQQQAWMRLHAGQHWLADAHLQASGFVAPAWLLSEGSRQALRCHGFDYTCTLRHLVLLDSGRTLCSQAQVWSSASAWRRCASVLWNGALFRWQHEVPWFRLELHPADFEHGLVRRSWQELLQRMLDQPRHILTLGALAERLRAAP